MLVLIDNLCLSNYSYSYLEINWIKIIGNSFKHNSESADGRCKHSIYRAVIEVYAII